MWTAQEIQDHKKAAALLTTVMRSAFAFLRDDRQATEGRTKDHILAEFRRHGLTMDRPFAVPIVAFNDHAAEPHYQPVPGARRLRPGTLVLIDIWARLKGRHMPYADITWMGYCGPKVPAATQEVFDAVIEARDACLKFITREARQGRLPTGRVADDITRQSIKKAGYGRHILHSTGHALGFVSPHGRGRHLSPKNRHPLIKDLGYTIEPGIYIKGTGGARSEMNFYIDRSGRVVITTPLQRQLVRI